MTNYRYQITIVSGLRLLRHTYVCATYLPRLLTTVALFFAIKSENNSVMRKD